MSQDTQNIQALINAAQQIGVYACTIKLEPREYHFDEPVRVDKPVRIVGNNSKIKLIGRDITAFDVVSSGCRFERLRLLGHTEGSNIADHGGIAFDVKAGRCVIDDCYIEYCRIGVFLHSTDEAATITVGNANRFIVRDTQFIWCLNGLWTRGGDANGGSVNDCMFIDCRKAITEQSFLGNHYVSNLVEACPWPGDPAASEGYGLRVPDEGGQANYSTFTHNYFENDSSAEVNHYCLVVGGNLTGQAARGERVGGWRAKLVFRGDDPNDQLMLGSPSFAGNLGFFKHGNDADTYASLGHRGQGVWTIEKYP